MAGDPSIVLALGIDLTTGIDRWILALDNGHLETDQGWGTDPVMVIGPAIDLETAIALWIQALDSVPLVIVRVMAIDPSIPVLGNVRPVIDPETVIDLAVAIAPETATDLIDQGTDLAMGTDRIDLGTGPVVLVMVTDQVWETVQAIGLVLAIVRWTLALDSGRPAIVRLDTGRPIIDLRERDHLGIVRRA